MELAEWTELCRQKEKGLPESKLLIGTPGISNRKKLPEKELSTDDSMKHVLKHGKKDNIFHGQTLQVTIHKFTFVTNLHFRFTFRKN